jgi:site-specific recombinase XerD
MHHGDGKMKNQKDKKNPHGCFERPPSSGIWWINYYENGKQRREKIGSKGAAIKAYGLRKAAILEGRKLPPPRRAAPVMVSDLIDPVLEYTANHRSARDYKSRGEIVRADLGSRPADQLTPQELEQWLRKRCKTAATWNRYKALLSLAYRQGIRNGKVPVNVARLVAHRKEESGRLRFLSREEYDRLHAVIAKRFPEHLAEFVISVHAGMRLSEQYLVRWNQVDFDRHAIDLTKTKNFSARTVHLNATAQAALESLRRRGQKGSDPVFSREGTRSRFDTRSWFQPCLAEAKITGYVWHENRHTFCSWLAMAGATTREIMEAAGHKTIAMAARYAHLSPQHTQSVVDRIADPSENPNMHQNMHQRSRGKKAPHLAARKSSA